MQHMIWLTPEEYRRLTLTRADDLEDVATFMEKACKALENLPHYALIEPSLKKWAELSRRDAADYRKEGL